MIMNRNLFVLLIAGFLIWTACQTPSPSMGTVVKPKSDVTWADYDFRIVTYNVENLFDLVDDPKTADDDFLPWGINRWNREKYETKIKRIFKVIANISSWEYPAVITLTEIENRTVLEDLIASTPLSESDYSIIHEESPDPRGIDVAMLYRRSFFRPIKHEALRISFPTDPYGRTRDVLYVEGLVHQEDTLHFYICHFPSRRGGEAISEPKRIHVASVVRNHIDSILQVKPNAQIIVTGDFNDEPANSSMEVTLRAKDKPENMAYGDLYNMMFPMYKKGYGTYKFQTSWNMLDQFAISAALLDSTSAVYTKPSAVAIYQPEWLEVSDDLNPGTKPFRTYSGPNYLGGYSDHFPVYMDLYFRRE
jgi:endonuclease/exonuclease/phosphatase family metal-dependent hydrolase